MNGPTRASLSTMVLLGVGVFGMNFFWGFSSGSLPLFLNDFSDSKFMISLPIGLGGALACIIPPIAGYFSDRTRTRFGRRRPYVATGMLFLFLSLLGLPHVTSLAAAIAVATLAGLFIHVASTPYVTLLPDLTPAEQRSTASGVMNFLGTIGGIVYFVIASEMWDEHPVGTIQMVAFVFLGCMLVPVVVLKEPEAPHLPVPQVEKAEMSKRANLLAHLKSITRETEVMKYLVAKFLWAFGLTIVWTFITLFVSEDLGVSEGKALWTHMVGTSVAVCFMLPLGMLGDRVNRKWLLFSMMALWTLLIVLLGFAQNFAQILLLLGISGISYATLLGVGYAFFLDLVPEERVGEFVGINAIVWAAPLAVAPLVAGALIDALGYRPMFLLAASFLAIGLVVFLFVHPRQRKETAWE